MHHSLEVCFPKVIRWASTGQVGFVKMDLINLYASSKVEGAGHAPHKADLTPPTPAAACRERPRRYLLIQSHPVQNAGKPPPQDRRIKPDMLGGMTRNMHFSAFWLSYSSLRINVRTMVRMHSPD